MLVLASMLGLLSVHCNAVNLTPMSPDKKGMMRKESADMSAIANPLPVGSDQEHIVALLDANGGVLAKGTDGPVDVEVGSKEHQDGMNKAGTRPEYDRPEYKVTERLTKSNTWEPCTVSPCWRNADHGDLKASVKRSEYKVLAVESSFKCMGKGMVKIRLTKQGRELKDGNLKIFLNHELHTEASPGSDDVDLHVDGQNVAIVRLELSPFENGSKEASAKIRMEARDVLQSYDTCMAHKKGTCLDKLGGNNRKEAIDLRNSKSLQFQCLGRSNPSCSSRTFADVCEEWLCCLSSETKALLKDLIGASLPAPPTAPPTTPAAPASTTPPAAAPATTTPPAAQALCSEGLVLQQRRGKVCCASSCGECKKRGCGDRPGGASECCPKDIKQKKQTCTTSDQVGCSLPSGWTRLLEDGARAPLPDASETTKSLSLPEVEDDEDDEDAPDHAECVDPESADPESWDCECMEAFTSACEDDEHRSSCLKGFMCSMPKVCGAWKETNCPDSLVQNALVNRARTTNNASKSAVALTDTLGDKCASQ